MKETKYTDINSRTIDRWVEEGWEWGIPISHKEFLDAKNGNISIFLTPTKPVPREWIPDLGGKRVLGLASGGGQQMPIFAAMGAECHVLDYSKRQIESELAVAKREGYEIHVYRADMTDPLPFPDGYFDLICHPVSNCYIRDVLPVWKECYRVLKVGGRLISGLDNGINFLFDSDNEERITGYLPFDPLNGKKSIEQIEKEGDGVQFSHTMEDQIGGQLKAGFSLLDLYEDTNGSGFLHEHGVPCFIATLAKK